MNTEKAALRFLGYRVDKMEFYAKTDFVVNKRPIELSPSFSREIAQIGEDLYDVTVGVNLEQDNLPFTAKLFITGKFECSGSLNADNMMRINAVAIMYPYVRATLSMMTTLAAIPPVIIPTINLAKMFEKEEREP